MCAQSAIESMWGGLDQVQRGQRPPTRSVVVRPVRITTASVLRSRRRCQHDDNRRLIPRGGNPATATTLTGLTT